MDSLHFISQFITANIYQIYVMFLYARAAAIVGSFIFAVLIAVRKDTWTTPWTINAIGWFMISVCVFITVININSLQDFLNTFNPKLTTVSAVLWASGIGLIFFSKAMIYFRLNNKIKKI